MQEMRIFVLLISRCALFNSLPVDAAHAELFDFEELLEAFAAAFLHAAEGRDLGRDDALVDADDVVIERLGDAPDMADVAAVERQRFGESRRWLASSIRLSLLTEQGKGRFDFIVARGFPGKPFIDRRQFIRSPSYSAPANSASISRASSASSCCRFSGQVGTRSNTALTWSLVMMFYPILVGCPHPNPPPQAGEGNRRGYFSGRCRPCRGI
jgi:hypothetical protein